MGDALGVIALLIVNLRREKGFVYYAPCKQHIVFYVPYPFLLIVVRFAACAPYTIRISSRSADLRLFCAMTLLK